jgi:hypothetical protein
MNLGLKRRKRNSLAINANITIRLVLGNDAVAENLAIAHKRLVEEMAAFDGEHEVEGFEPADVPVDGDQVHVAVVWEGRGKEVRVGGHVGHLGVLAYWDTGRAILAE